MTMQGIATRQSPGEQLTQRLAQPATSAGAWFKSAVIYEVMPQSFFDANNDVIGDLQGIVEKLDYLVWLGVDAIALTPFFASPMQDAGYDVADFMCVAPQFGSQDDVRQLLDAAHKKRLRVILDIPLSHTSEQHAWFQESSSSRDNEKSDWYIWRDNAEQGAGPAFLDDDAQYAHFDRWHWVWSTARQQYYMHRFAPFEPDLNFNNSRVREAMYGVVQHWLDMGFDGIRVVSAPWWDTHGCLQELRARISATHPDAVLTVLPEDSPIAAADYLDAVHEMHMCTSSSLASRMFLSLRKENRFPIAEFLAKTPEIPDECQWEMFLRSHDEVCVDSLDDDDREFMMREFGRDARTLANGGIARRLLPMLGNDRRVVELMYAMLLSFPGTPKLYYGDEIGMGDNVHLHERAAVRTPMQWSSDRNGGFSKASFADMYSAPLHDAVYGSGVINVESQQRDASSLLSWLRHMLLVRKRVGLFGTGAFEVLAAENPSVFAYSRQLESRVVLCVNNLSRFAQPLSLTMPQFSGRVPRELLGSVAFPAIGDLPYFITLAPHQFYWFELEAPSGNKEH